VGHTTSGLRDVLSRPGAYELWSRLVGASHARGIVAREYIRPAADDRVLDLGCGPGELVRYLGGARYLGIDMSEAYIARASRVYGHRAEFRVRDVTALEDDLGGFDIAVAFGLVHHLDNAGAERLLSAAAAALRPGGRLVTVDPVLAPGERWLARFVIAHDRGRHVRTVDEYARLAELALTDVRPTVRGDLLRIPYTHCVLEATAP
jgi:SAM-dependent methyltransferase